MAQSFLFNACESGMLEWVENEHRSRTAEVWKADVNAMIEDHRPTQLITSRSSFLHGVSPLFIASLNKHSQIVRYLVKNEADVSAGLSNANSNDWNAGLTPLHAAFFSEDRHFYTSSKQLDIIRCLVEAGADPSALSSKGIPIWMMGWIRFYPTDYSSELRSRAWCNPQAVRLLIELGMSLTLRCPVGRNILHHLAGPALMDDTEVFNFLLEKGADLNARDNDGITPIMAAAIGNNKLPNIAILKLLLEKEEISNVDKIGALEVASAVILIYEARLSSYPSEYLFEEEQYVDHHEEMFDFLLRAKSLSLETPSLTHEISLIGRAVESFTSLENFQHIKLRPSEYLIQSILIRLKIFSSLSWGAIHRYLWPFITDEYYQKIRSDRDFSLILDFSCTLLETMSPFNAQEESIYDATIFVVEYFYDALYNDLPLVNIETVKKLLDTLKTAYQVIPPDDDHSSSRYLNGFYKLILALHDLPVLMGTQQVADFVRFIISQNGRDSNGRTFLHKAVREPTGKVLERVGLLLRNGADARAVDRAGDGILHYLAKKRGNEQRETVARMLLEHGVDLDRTNSDGKTAADVWREKTKERIEEEEDYGDYESYYGDTDDDRDEQFTEFNADPPDWVKMATSRRSND